MGAGLAWWRTEGAEGELINASRRLRELERRFAATVVDARSYEEALAIFTALWQHARHIQPAFPGDWREDVQTDIEMARVLNGLHPNS